VGSSVAVGGDETLGAIGTDVEVGGCAVIVGGSPSTESVDAGIVVGSDRSGDMTVCVQEVKRRARIIPACRVSNFFDFRFIPERTPW
jgi:hypothetical protein